MSILTRRVLPAAVAAACMISLAACAPQESAPTADSGKAADSSAPAYKVKRGELPEFLGEDFSTEGAEFNFEDPLPVTQVFHDVRGGEHADFYRVVVEFKRDSSSEKRTESPVMRTVTNWVEEANSLGKGDKLDNSGKALLDVVVENTTVPMTDDQQKFYYAGDKHLSFDPIDVTIDGTVEGNTHIVVGMDKKREYQVNYLTDPTRVVIDIKK